MGSGMECDNRIENARPVVWGHRRPADDPGQKLVVGNLHQRLEIGEIVIPEVGYMGICERPKKQVHLPHPTMPGAKERAPAARVEALAGS
jgi:hypothetical protein